MNKMLVMLAVVVLAGCTTTQKSATVGGLGGATIGGIIGHQSDHGIQGAAIGGAVGAVGGMLAGDRMSDKKFCPECGREYSADSRFCPVDGTELKLKQ